MFCPPIVEDRRLANLIKNYGLWTNTSSKDKAVPTNRTIDRPVLKDAKVILDMLENFIGKFTDVGSYIWFKSIA